MLADALLLLAAALSVAKTSAYVIETGWFAVRGHTLREHYHNCPNRTYALDRENGRPRPLSIDSDSREGSGVWRRAWELAFKAPIVVTINYIVIAMCARWGSAPVLVAVAAASAVLGVCMVLSPVVFRLTLGPYDALNPDLRVWRPLAKRIYLSPSPSSATAVLTLYSLALIILTIMSFSAAYTALGAIPGIVTDAPYTSTSPVRWLYSAVSVSATEGLGDIRVQSDWVRLLVMAQMLLGPLALTWVVTAFFGASLPQEVVDRLSRADHADRHDGRAPTAADRVQ